MSETAEKIVLVFVGAILGAFLPAIRDLIARLLRRPKVSVEVSAAEGFVAPARMGRQVEDMRGDGGWPPNFTRTEFDDGAYARVRVTNLRGRWWAPDTARKCVGYLAAVQRWDAGRGDFVNAGYDDFLQLAWSHNGTAGGMDLLPDTPHWLDVFCGYDGTQAFYLGTVQKPNRYLPGFEGAGCYRFVVQLSGENVESRKVNVYLNWTGDWRGMEVMDEAAWGRRRPALPQPPNGASVAAVA